MYDKTSVGLLSVFIRNLTRHDQGTYKCKVDNDSNLEFKLEEPVKHGKKDFAFQTHFT